MRRDGASLSTVARGSAVKRAAAQRPLTRRQGGPLARRDAGAADRRAGAQGALEQLVDRVDRDGTSATATPHRSSLGCGHRAMDEQGRSAMTDADHALPTPAEMLARAEAFRPRLLAEQAATEARGYCSQELREEFRAASFYRLPTPRRHGGLEHDLPASTA